jgi:hypothetical protein
MPKLLELYPNTGVVVPFAPTVAGFHSLRGSSTALFDVRSNCDIDKGRCTIRNNRLSIPVSTPFTTRVGIASEVFRSESGAYTPSFTSAAMRRRFHVTRGGHDVNQAHFNPLVGFGTFS